MDANELLKIKKKTKDIFISKNNLIKTNKILWYIDIYHDLLTDDFLEWLASLDINFVIKTQDNMNFEAKNIIFTPDFTDDYVCFDFIVCDEQMDYLSDFTSRWVIPIIYTQHHSISLFKEFFAPKVEWNAFLFEKMNKWSIFASIIRYAENFKFPYDNRALVKNILEI